MSKIVMSISADSPEELFSTILGAAKLIREDVPPAEPDKPANPTPAPVATPVSGTPQAAISNPAPSNPTAFATPPTASNVNTPAPVPTAPTPAATPAPPPAQPPVAPPPTYTHEQIGKAGADLIAANPSLMPALMELLKRYGANMVTDLKPEQLGPFAIELRAMGAKL